MEGVVFYPVALEAFMWCLIVFEVLCWYSFKTSVCVCYVVFLCYSSVVSLWFLRLYYLPLIVCAGSGCYYFASSDWGKLFYMWDLVMNILCKRGGYKRRRGCDLFTCEDWIYHCNMAWPWLMLFDVAMIVFL